jgi:hypothetical protein
VLPRQQLVRAARAYSVRRPVFSELKRRKNRYSYVTLALTRGINHGGTEGTEKRNARVVIRKVTAEQALLGKSAAAPGAKSR